MDELPWRFTGGEEPPQFTYFMDGERHDQLIEGSIATAVIRKFGIDEVTVRRALEVVAAES